ncbi:MAG: prepilin peptidase [Acidobacteria bacterium]|nr:prepilin peptidase [Acidobacteriota bacterium]
MEIMPESLRWGIFLLAVVSSVTDLRNRTIPNWLTIPLTVFGLGARWYTGGWESLREGMAGALIGFGVYFLFFVIRARGGGDVKLMGAYGALMGTFNWFVLFILAGVLGGVVAFVVIVAKGRLGQTWRNLTGLAGKDRVTLDSKEALSLPHGAVAGFPAIVIAWAAGLPTAPIP